MAEAGGAAGQWWPVVDESRLSDGAAFGADCGALRIAVYQVAGALYATDSLCTHAFVPLEDGMLDGYEIECPVHQARFDVRNGECRRFPADKPLRVFQTRREAGVVQVWIPAGTV